MKGSKLTIGERVEGLCESEKREETLEKRA